ncbi:hypothetical protein [Hyphomicrobium sulfonivorans]|uniref:hypothetical protein n=1 Tax=Hyphomicrobium sulfonivorans TaxID=121290 RepID=UPI0012EE7A3B|nr:hypothetical protein [Hyphomicrobium sulfonivorans]
MSSNVAARAEVFVEQTVVEICLVFLGARQLLTRALTLDKGRHALLIEPIEIGPDGLARIATAQCLRPWVSTGSGITRTTGQNNKENARRGSLTGPRAPTVT